MWIAGRFQWPCLGVKHYEYTNMLSLESLTFQMKFGRLRRHDWGHESYSGNPVQFIIPTDWQIISLYLFGSLFLLFVTAYLAQINLARFPKNPLRWHFFVLIEVINSSDKYEKTWLNAWWVHALLFWMSAALLALFLITLLFKFSYILPNNSLDW